MIWCFADAWGFGLALLAWLFAGFASLRSGRAGALSGFALLCPVVAIWLRSSLFALRSSSFVPVVSWLRCDLLCLVLASLRYGLVRPWLCRCPVPALCSGLDRLRRSGLVMPVCLRSAQASALWRFGFGMVCFASAYVWRFGSSNALRFTIWLLSGAALSVPGALRSGLLCTWLCRGEKIFMPLYLRECPNVQNILEKLLQVRSD